MSLLHIFANIAQIVSVIWIIFFGGKLIFDFIKSSINKTFHSQRLNLVTISNVLIGLTFLTLTFILSDALGANPFFGIGNATPTPTSTNVVISPSPTPTVIIAENMTIACVSNCIIFNVHLNNIVINKNEPSTIFSFTITNNSAKVCSDTNFSGLSLQNISSGATFNGQSNDTWSLGPGNSLVENAIFLLIPETGGKYTLSMTLSCNGSLIVYQPVTITF